jgi:hypothetical protein
MNAAPRKEGANAEPKTQQSTQTTQPPMAAKNSSKPRADQGVLHKRAKCDSFLRRVT